jgi:hypothetical protein
MAELLDFTKSHVLRNEAEYTTAVAEIDHSLPQLRRMGNTASSLWITRGISICVGMAR